MHKIAEIHLPEQDNTGLSNHPVHAHLQRLLCDRYGGFNRLPRCDSGWLDAAGEPKIETVSVYRFAAEDSAAAAERIKTLARDLAVFAKQSMVRVVLPSGRAILVRP